MAKLRLLILHCTDTPACRPVTKEDIELWHLKERGWSRVGYSDMIHQDGKIENLIPYNDDDWISPWEKSNGVGKKIDGQWINSMARHVVFVGGKSCKGTSKDTRTARQRIAGTNYIRAQITMNTDILVAGHTTFDRHKSCPNFNVAEWCRALGIEEKNIYNPLLNLNKQAS